MDPGSLALALDGPAATRADWEKAAAAVLRRAGRLTDADPDEAVWDKLARTTLDGVRVSPLGSPELTAAIAAYPRPVAPEGHDVRVQVPADGARGNAEALADLAGGATSLWLRGGDDLDGTLQGVLLDLAPVVLDDPAAPRATAEQFLRRLGDATPAAGTNLGAPADADPDDLVAVARLAIDAGALGVVVDAVSLHDRGASDAQEVGWSMALAARALRVLEEAGIQPADAARLVEFRYAATDEQFATIAKLRAARLTWLRLLELCGVEPVEQRQHAVTSQAMLSTYDPWVNMLRTTVAAFAATVGGAGAVTVLPFDRPLGRPDAFGRRIARNQLALLLAESHVGLVAAPAGGAWAVERLTHDLAVAGWEVFGALESGEAVEDLVAATVERRDRLVATRRLPITGLTEFPNLAETLPVREPDPAPDDVRRYGAAFEALRDEPATRPVFLATLGPVAAHTARATYAANLLAAGGIGVERAGATGGVDDLLAAYSGQPVVCLAGNDATYAAWGGDAVRALRAAGARRVVIAGAPGDLEVDDSFAVGVDALAFLRRTREALA